MRTASGIAAFILTAIFIVHLMEANRPSTEAYEEALLYFKTHALEIRNKEYLTLIDFTKPSYAKRMHIFSLETGEVERYLVAHGENSGFTYARDFSNEIGSRKSCGGFFITGERYDGKHGPSLRLHGKEKGINDNAFRRDIVIHGADWVSYSAVLENGGRLGRSWGCPAVPASEVEEIVEKIKDGSLLYIYVKKPVDEQSG
jgi:hypothetical protein